MEVIIGRSFENETVLLDGKQFEECSFNYCIIKYGASAPGRLIRCKTKNTTYTFVDAAERTLQTLAGLYQTERTLIEELFTQIRSPRPTTEEQ